MLKLAVKERTEKEKPDTLRKKGIIPAVYYGKKQKATPISVALKDFLKVFKEAGESTVVTLSGKDGEIDSLIQDVDIHPVTSVPRHADFYVFEKGQKIEVSVPIEYMGVSPAVKDLGGILVKVLYQLKIEAEPKHLPHNISVDISSLTTFESVILAKDIKLPAGVVLKERENEVVASVTEFKEEKEEAPVDLSAIEVEKKGKAEEEGAEGAETPKEAKAEPESPKKQEKK